MNRARLVLTGLVAILLVTACDILPTAPGNPEASEEAPMVAVAPSAPDEVVRGFLEAWNRQDFPAMYGFVAEPSRERYPYALFETRYIDTHEKISFGGVAYRIDDVRVQGSSAAVQYDVTLESVQYGAIEDPDRTIRLVRAGAGWQIAWSPLDIIDGLASEVRLEVLSRFPARANIYDRNGLPLVEEGGNIMLLSVVRQDMADEARCLNLLAEVVMRSRASLRRLFANFNPETFFNVGEIDPERYFAYRDDLINICGTEVDPGFGLDKTLQYTERSYYGHGAAAHVTGYIGFIPQEELPLWRSRGYGEGGVIGLTGIERSYEQTLAGRPETVLRMIEPGGAVIRELGGTSGAPPAPVTLTIDRELQMVTAQAINDAYNYAETNWASVAAGGAAVVIDVNTGEVLAMASYPTFDPGIFNPDTAYTDRGTLIQNAANNPLRPLTNKAVQEQYTPGSVYKVITTLAAANERVWDPQDIFECNLTWEDGPQYGDTVSLRQDWRVVDEMPAAGPVNMPQALSTSCNPFFWEMGGLLFRKDPALLARYSENLGLGQPTGIQGLAVQEARGNVASPRFATEAINNAIGQGDVQVTALQMAVVVSAIANGGTVYQPYIVQQVGGVDGTPETESFEPEVVRELNLTPETLQAVRAGMCAVPTDEDLGTSVRVFGSLSPSPATYAHCGKTGTAQTGDVNSGRPPHSWYIAYAPAENPQIAIAVVVPNSREGSEVSAPIVRRILDNWFNAPIAGFPDWWTGEYVPVQPPVGVASDQG